MPAAAAPKRGAGSLHNFFHGSPQQIEEQKQAEIARAKSANIKAIQQWINTELGKAWRKWRIDAAQTEKQRQQIGTAVFRWIRGKLSRSFEKWQTEAETKEEAILQSKPCCCNPCFLSIKAALIKREKAAINGALNRMLNRELSAGFEKWQAEAEQTEEA